MRRTICTLTDDDDGELVCDCDDECDDECACACHEHELDPAADLGWPSDWD